MESMHLLPAGLQNAMKKRVRFIRNLLYIAGIAVSFGMLVVGWDFCMHRTVRVQIRLAAPIPGGLQVYYCAKSGEAFSDKRCIPVRMTGTPAVADVVIPARRLCGLRFDFGTAPGEFTMLGGTVGDEPLPSWDAWSFSPDVTVKSDRGESGELKLFSDGTDPYMFVLFRRPIQASMTLHWERLVLMLALALAVALVAISFKRRRFSPRIVGIAVLFGTLLAGWNFCMQRTIRVQVRLDAPISGGMQIYYCARLDEGLSEKRCLSVCPIGTPAVVDVAIPAHQLYGLRLDFGIAPGEFTILGGTVGDEPLPPWDAWSFSPDVMVKSLGGAFGELKLFSDGDDPYMFVPFHRPIQSSWTLNRERFLLMLVFVLMVAPMMIAYAESYISSSKFGFLAKYINKTTLANLFFCCSPLLVFLLVLYLLNANPFRWVPLWNDEVGWYIDIHSVIEHGSPLGFTGYNETHAAVGRFGPWGGFLVCLMALFGKVFGWSWCSQLFMNVFFMTLANFVFLLFAKPSRHTALKLGVLNFVSFVSIYFMFTGMSECTRFSLSIVLAGLFFFLLKEENRGKRSYFIVLSIIAPILLFIFINCYFMFAFLLPVYGYVWYRYLNITRFRSLSVISLCVLLPTFFVLVCFFIQVETSAPYPTNTLQAYLKQPSVAAFLTTLKEVIAWNYEHSNFTFLFGRTEGEIACASSHVFFYYILLIAVSIKLVVSLKINKKINILNLLVVYALSVWVLAFLIFYSTELWVYVRGLNVALVFSLYLVCMLDWPKLHLVLFGLIFVQFFPFITKIKDDMAMRYSVRNKGGGGYEMFEKYLPVFSSKLTLSESNDAWDNTVAFYGKTYNFDCVIPAGLSWNYILDNHPVSKPRYIITDKSKNWAFAGYEKTYSDDLFNIFEKVVRGVPISKKNERTE